MRCWTWMGFVALAACDDGSVRFGPANGLERSVPNDIGPPPSEAGPAPACAPPGDAAACPSFAADIYPMLQPSVWGCAAAKCHGPNLVSLQGDAPTVYETLAKYVGGNGKTYINPACTELDQSSFDCDVVGVATKPCWVAAKMPVVDPSVGNHAPTNVEISKLEDWIKCGAPK